MAEEERMEAEMQYLYAMAATVKQKLREAGWQESELNQLEQRFCGEYLSLQHPDKEEM